MIMSSVSVPSLGGHLELSLNGRRVAVLEHVKLNALSSKNCLHQNEVTSSNFECVWHDVSSDCSGEKGMIEVNNKSSLLTFDSTLSANQAEAEQIVAENDPSLSPDDDEHEGEDIEPSALAWVLKKSKKRRHKKRKRNILRSEIYGSNNSNKNNFLNSKNSNKNFHSNIKKSTQDVYNDLTLLKRVNDIEAICKPATFTSTILCRNQQPKKNDYSQFIGDKLTKKVSSKSSPSSLQKRADIILKNARNLIEAQEPTATNKFIRHKFIQNGKKEKLSPVNMTPYESASASMSLNVKHSNNSGMLNRKSISSAPGVHDIVSRISKIYLSEKQTNDVEEHGIEFPGAPPATPTPDMLKKYEFVPSMHDIRSQRSVRMKLDQLAKIEKQKKEKLCEERMKKEKIKQKEKIKEMRKQQRKEIYALNKKMTEFEHQNFAEFSRKNGLPVST